jgi:zinc protease
MKLIFLSLFFVTNIYASSEIEKSIKRLNWNGIDVVYLEDNRFPTYDMVMYFADGALSDGNHPGETQHAFNLADSGTTKFSQKEILDQLEFLGTDFSAEVTHEYSTMSLTGLSKDLNTAMSQVCHVLRQANYPKDVIKKELDLERSELQAMVSAPQVLSDRVFRAVTLDKTPYAYPVSGKLNDLAGFTPEGLRAKTDYFLNNVKKRIYLTGPKNILSVEKILKDECGLVGKNDDFIRVVDEKIKKTKNRNISRKNNSKNKNQIVFVPVPDANQVQVKIGRILNSDEITDRTGDLLAMEFLGGGFTSRLMREVRVKRGLTYSIGSYISAQKQYGRAGISTFTKNETVNRLIEVIEDTLLKIQKDGIKEEDFNHSRGSLVGSHPFKFEVNKAFLMQLLLLDHVERPYAELFNFNEAVVKYNAKDIQEKIDQVFGLGKQVIFVLGDKSIEAELRKLPKKYGKMKVLDFKKFI